MFNFTFSLFFVNLPKNSRRDCSCLLFLTKIKKYKSAAYSPLSPRGGANHFALSVLRRGI
jgi:hypothetical protein